MCLYPEEPFKASVLFIPSDPQKFGFLITTQLSTNTEPSLFPLSSALTLFFFDKIHRPRPLKANKLAQLLFLWADGMPSCLWGLLRC